MMSWTDKEWLGSGIVLIALAAIFCATYLKIDPTVVAKDSFLVLGSLATGYAMGKAGKGAAAPPADPVP
jgi:hypothetical protein